jgi:ATP-dependent helicase/nuclease subunit A
VNTPETISAICWTDQQRKGIEAGGSVLVSAAAGSGKTTVLAERCAYLVCDADKPCGVDELLVVTFTESAAAEMKSRIQQALRRRIAQNPSDRLLRQSALVEHAQISTVHGFCARLLRQHFNLVGLDPNFNILDGDEAALLRREVVEDLFHQRYKQDRGGDFHRLIDAYGDGDDESLMEQVVATHQTLCSLADPQSWIARTLTEIRQAASQPLTSSQLGQQLIQQIKQTLSDLARQCDDAAAAIRPHKALASYVKHAQELKSIVGHWHGVLDREGLDLLIGEVGDLPSRPRLPAVPADTPGKEPAKAMLDSIKKQLDDALPRLLAFDSTQWQQGMAQVSPHAKAFLSLVSDFEQHYKQAKGSQRAVDFSDLERLTLRVLSDGQGSQLLPSRVARSLQDQFRYVLVDEYQDINEIQDAILTLVSRESAGSGREPNLFCVGDVKQSIFRFRLAEPRRFLQRLQRFSSPAKDAPGRVIDLRENFRSRAPLLEAINAIYERLMTRQAAEIEYDQSHRLRPGRPYPPAGSARCFAGAPIELHLLPADVDDPDQDMERAEYEAVLVAQRIRRLMGLDGSPPMHVIKPDAVGNPVAAPLGFGDIVILLRAMQYKADAFVDVLRAHGIPVHSEGGSGFFDSPEVRDALCLLQILDNQQQDIPLAAVLRSPLSGLPQPDDAMAAIRLAYRDGADPAEDIPFHEALRRYAVEKDDELSAWLRDFLARLADWRDQANKRPVAELLWRLYQDTGALAYYSGLDDGQQRVANLLYLHERAAQFGTFLRQGLYRFLDFISNLRQEKDLARPALAAEPQNVVRIMSIHRAKGLEFPVVFLADLGKRHNLKDLQGSILVDRQSGLGMKVTDQSRLIRYPSLASAVVENSLLRQTLAEEMRLLYVAMTRAKEHLILLGTATADQVDRWETQWRDRTGPLPADVVLAGSRSLDWLGPVAAMTASLKPPPLQVFRHDPAELQSWKNPRSQSAPWTDQQQKMARLEKLSPPPPANALAQGIIQRFEQAYPFAAFTQQAAAMAVTELAKHAADAAPAGPTPAQRKLDLPRFFVESASPKPTDIGTATHLVLQHWDFAGDAAPIERQIQLLADRKLISRAQAAMVDRQAIGFLLASDVGKMLGRRGSELMREVPFVACSDEASPGCVPMDRVMIRGRIDVLAPSGDGITIVDYKTDNIAPEALPQRARSYDQQMKFYRQAIEQVAGKKVTAVHLVFLSARAIVTV